ncbi:MAG: YhbY family RNA-binding protein [Sulfolobales archaeon]
MQKKKIVNTVLGRPQICLGKAGINENVLNDIKRYLKKEGVVKIRVMKSYKMSRGADVEAIAYEVARAVNGEVVDVRGSTFVIVKKGGAAGGT